MVHGKILINGIFHGPELNNKKINPSTGELLGMFPQCDEKTVHSAVAAASLSFDTWKNISRIRRGEYLDKACQLLKNKYFDRAVEIISLETGKSLNESKAEVVEAIHMLEYCYAQSRMETGYIVDSELSERECHVFRKPKGVVAVISPWNFPFAISGFWNSAAALLEGNTVVLKPSEDSPFTADLIAEMFNEANLPPGVFNVIHGDGKVGEMLVKHNQVRHICFTGSAIVGQEIRKICAVSFNKTCSCEMGSKSAVIVFDDADMNLAADAALQSAFKLSGQRCVSSGRILIQENVFEKFKERFLPMVHKVRPSNPFHMVTDNDALLTYGPLINENQLARVLKYNEMARTSDKTKVLVEANTISPGFFISPFVYETPWHNDNFLKHEVFGPHLALIPFKDVHDAIRIYNDTNYGLAVGIITNNYRIMRHCKLNCDAGMIYFNLGSIGAESHLPFTGVKDSGYGGGSAAATFRAVTQEVACTINHGDALTFPQGLK